MYVPGGIQINPGQVTGPSTVQPQMNPQMMQRLQLLRNLMQQRGGGMPMQGMTEGAPILGGNGQPIAGRRAPMYQNMAGGPTITSMAQPVRQPQPVTTQAPVQPGLPTLPNRLAQRLAVFRGG